MMRISAKQIIDVGGVLAVIASLVFVGVQLRQEQIFARAALGSVTLESSAEFDQRFQDPVVASIYIKMISDPKELSIEEMTQANAILEHIVILWTREGYLFDLGIFGEDTRVVGQYAERIFGNAYAKAWWSSAKDRFPDFSDRFSNAIESVDSGASLALFSKIQAQL